MDLSTFFLAIALVAVIAGITFAIQIVAFLQARGHRINWIFIRILIIRYISQYRDITIRETGKAGSLYPAYITAMLTALVAAIVGLALR